MLRCHCPRTTLCALAAADALPPHTYAASPAAQAVSEKAHELKEEAASVMQAAKEKMGMGDKQ